MRGDALFELLRVAVVLELDHDADLARLRRVEHFAERGEPDGAESRIEAAADVDGPQVGGGRVPDIERRFAELHQVAVVDDDYFAVARFLHVDFDPVGAVLDGLFAGGDGVLGRARAAGAMGRDLDVIIQPYADHRRQRRRRSKRQLRRAATPIMCLAVTRIAVGGSCGVWAIVSGE